jgi:2-polyprenyl-6-methoxyphenol hydroxylase-like FAD-dependent oxidoreductase
MAAAGDNGQTRRRALVIGGSVAGLAVALHLRRAGWRADVFERSTEPLSGRGAGIVTHPELRSALALLGVDVAHDFGVAIKRRVMLDDAGAEVATLDLPQIATSWSHVHGQLARALPAPHVIRGADLTGITHAAGAITAHFADGRQETGDLLVGADGVRSRVRRHLFPDIVPDYAGYVAWRGMAPEHALADATGLPDAFAFHLPPGEQMLAYPVPGPGHALAAGRRSLNFVWYRPADTNVALKRLLTDGAGVTHTLAIAPDAIAPAVVADLRKDAERLLPIWFRRIVAATAQPFLQPIFDCVVPRLHGPRIALVGDAAYVVRPHVGAGVLKAIGDAAALARCLPSGNDIDAALATYTAERGLIGGHMVARARRLGSHLKYTYGSTEERSAAMARRQPAAVLAETATVDFLRETE